MNGDETPANLAPAGHVRPAFVARMEHELADLGNQAKNVAHGGWAGWRPDHWQILFEIRTHVTKLALAFDAGDRDLVSHHAADLAVLAMKASEVHGTD